MSTRSFAVLSAAMLFAAMLAGAVLSPRPARAATGASIAGPDFNGDGFADLASGIPGEDVDGASNAGAVEVVYGSAGGLSGDGEQFWSQASGIGDQHPGRATGSEPPWPPATSMRTATPTSRSASPWTT